MTGALPAAAHAVAEWLPVWQAAGVFFATFVLEDVATVGAGLLLAAGALSWPAAFTACFLGIWLGDAGLYALARFAGRSWFDRSAFRKHAARVARSESWFAERGVRILIFSRFVPGARLPTFLAAGFLRVPAGRFLLVTGLAAFGWTLIILCLVQAFGERLLGWLGAYKSAGYLLLGAGLVLFLSWRLLRRVLMDFDARKFAAAFGRWQRWEFWPAWLFYPPVAVYYLWLSVKHRGAMLPTVANPGIYTGGMVGESKMATLGELMQNSPEFTAEAERLVGATAGERLASLREICDRRQIPYPFILKPDLGQRGQGIKLIRTEAQAVAYLEQMDTGLLVQRFAPGPHEVGIYYYRFPGEPRGRIFSITEKVFPVLTGDGQTTVRELVWRDPRARFIAETYLRRLGARQSEVLPAGEQLQLVQAGNHAQGCIFRDGGHLATPELTERIDQISRQLTGFFIGRYDIRFPSEPELRAGKNFQIIELNGASAEAASIYDARYSVFHAYRTLFRQWDLVFAIGAENRRRGAVPLSVRQCWREWRHYHAIAAAYPPAD